MKINSEGDACKNEIFSELDSLLEAGVLNLYGVTLEMLLHYNISIEKSRLLFKEWAEKALLRYRELVGSGGGAARLR
ncbi:MAG: hypothetical protein NTZ78_09160 [Candidatus Aureabacteria bacterium]|nr:hypothetical protein [Candidatus Auribacterota bacterium]